jgi:hypothetical protein
MSARCLTALCNVLIFGLCTGRAEPVSSPDRKVVVYLRKAPALENDRTVSYMQRELETQLKSAGYAVNWKALGGPFDDGKTLIVVVELRGACRAPEAGVYVKPVDRGASLASTAVDGDQVLPFSWINCETLTQLLAPELTRIEPGQRDFLYGRAMGRLLAHELYHVLANKREHDDSGVAKESFNASDVLGEHFIFEGTALAGLKIEPGSATDLANAEEDPATAR